MNYMTKEEIVKEIVDSLADEERASILRIVKPDEMGQFHHTFGMYVRNHYKLWEQENPLTQIWFEACDNKDLTYIIDGVDCHPNHPDAVSGQIMKMIWHKVHKPDPDLLSLVDIGPRPKDEE